MRGRPSTQPPSGTVAARLVEPEQSPPPPAEASIDAAAGTPETTGTRRRFAERLVVDTSEKRPVYLLLGKNGSYIRLSPSSYQLLRQIDQGSSFAQLAEQINQQGDKQVSASDVEAAYRKLDQTIAAIEERAEPQRAALWFRRRIISEAMVNRLARILAPAFHPVAAFCFFAVIAVAAYLLLQRGLHLQSGHFLSGYGLFIASTMVHELGHSSACSRYGARPSEIGFGFYLFFPAFYSNVNSAWELKRWQRMVVDVAGVYFQLIVAAGFALAYLATGWEPLGVAIVMILGACLFSLNPILKFDGYWLVADALGVTNLGQQPRRMFRHLADRMHGRPTAPLPWSPSVSWTLVLYTMVSVGFWIWFLWRMLPLFIRLVLHYPELLTKVVNHLDTRLLGDLFASTLMLAFMGFMWWRLVRAIFVGTRARLSRSRRVPTQ